MGDYSRAMMRSGDASVSCWGRSVKRQSEDNVECPRKWVVTSQAILNPPWAEGESDAGVEP